MAPQPGECSVAYRKQSKANLQPSTLLKLTQDSSYHQQRSKYSILLSHGNPVKGGSWTHFADMRRAYADLPETKKKEIEDLIVEHE
jgi:alpha-ketoglutarate-dependent taurine dioxygenase